MELLVRFCEYEYGADDPREKARYITGFRVEDNYDRFVGMIQKLVGHDIELKYETYYLDDYALSYGGKDEDAVCLNVYCIGQ